MDKCAQLCVEWNKGHIEIDVRRQFLLRDSLDAVKSLSRNDMRKLWRFEFIGEDDRNVDYETLTREWIVLIWKAMFDPDLGLWKSSTSTNPHTMTINPASSANCCDIHLLY